MKKYLFLLLIFLTTGCDHYASYSWSEKNDWQKMRLEGKVSTLMQYDLSDGERTLVSSLRFNEQGYIVEKIFFDYRTGDTSYIYTATYEEENIRKAIEKSISYEISHDYQNDSSSMYIVTNEEEDIRETSEKSKPSRNENTTETVYQTHNGRINKFVKYNDKQEQIAVYTYKYNARGMRKLYNKDNKLTYTATYNKEGHLETESFSETRNTNTYQYNNGILSSVTYKFSGNVLKEIFDDRGKSTIKSLFWVAPEDVYDETKKAWMPVTRPEEEYNTEEGCSITYYEYTYDEKGNWISVITSKNDLNADPDRAERMIEYFE